MTYAGGKGNCYHTIINQMPPHAVYIEPFLGGGTVMRLKRPAPINIGVERDFHALQSTMASIADCGDGISRLFICGDALAFLAGYKWRGDELVYLDPPYPKATRRDGRDVYRFELTDSHHVRLLDLIIALPCRVMISSYWSDLYAVKLASWRSITFQTMTRGGLMAQEWLWMNYGQPVRLHDYRYLGDTFREREVITRRKRRWVARLAKMTDIERLAMLAAIDDVYGSSIAESGDRSPTERPASSVKSKSD
jgi:hypothetical protein